MTLPILFSIIQVRIVNFFCSPHGIKERTNKLMLLSSIVCLCDFAVAYGNVRTRIHSRSDFSVLIQHCLNVENTGYL